MGVRYSDELDYSCRVITLRQRVGLPLPCDELDQAHDGVSVSDLACELDYETPLDEVSVVDVACKLNEETLHDEIFA